MKSFGYNFVKGCTWIGVMSLFAACVPAASGQEAPPEIPRSSGPLEGPDRQHGIEDSAKEPDAVTGRRRTLVGPQPVTPEQQEEAERLKQLGAKYGTDPTAIVGRVQLSSTYFDLPQGRQGIDTLARVDLALGGKYVLRTDVPVFKMNDPNRPGATSLQGFSDLSVTVARRVYSTPEYTVLVGVTSTFPTGTEPGLSLGKYTLGPTLATARFLPRLDSLLLGLFTHQVSVAGDPARSSVNISKATLQVNSFWAQRWWSVVQAEWRVDWERNARSNMTVELELGRNVAERLGVFVRPGVGIWGQDLPGAYTWSINGGVRYMFRSF